MKKCTTRVAVVALLCLSINFCLPQLAHGQCNCTDFIYLNDTGLEYIEKFRVEADGSLTEIGDAQNGNPWMDANGVLDSPHGVGGDLNGFLYIGSNINNNIRRVSCDGEILDIDPDTPMMDNLTEEGFAFNHFTIGNLLYGQIWSNSSTSTSEVRVYDICAGARTGCQRAPVAANFIDFWGFTNGNDGYWYATGVADNGTGLQEGIWRGLVDPAAFDDGSGGCGTFELFLRADQLGLNPNNTRMMGITFDDAGNMYVTVGDNGGFQPPSFVIKYRPDGTFFYSLTDTTTDSDDTAGFNWAGARGIVWSQASGLLYVSSGDDCVAAFDPDDLSYLPNASVHITGSFPKGIGIVTECCPDNPTETIEIVQCVTSTSLPVFINEILPCPGIVCEAQWEAVGTASMSVYEECNQTIVTGASADCYTFNRTSDGMGSKQCGPINQTLHVEIIVLPDLVVGADQSLACGEAAAALTATTTGNILRWEQTTSYANALDEDWTAIPGTAGLTSYNPGLLSETTYFRAVQGASSSGNTANCTGGNCELASNPVTITLPDNCPPGTFDLALTKMLASSQSTTIAPGDDVTFTIEVTNQGDVNAFNVTVSDYFPADLTLNDANWTESPMGTAVLNTPIAFIPVNTSETVDITFTLSNTFVGTSISNDAEITAADDDNDPNNTPPTDRDSTPGDNGTPNDASGNDDTSDTTGGDDQDIETVMVAPPPSGAGCDCTEYIYLNETTGGGAIHKYAVEQPGSLLPQEIGSPWYDNSVTGDDVSNPHGIAGDLNGFLYVGETDAGEIRRITCDGDIRPTSEFEIDVQFVTNIFSVGNTIYINNYDSDGTASTSSNEGVYAYDVCDPSAPLGFICLDGIGLPYWGLDYDPQTGTVYATAIGYDASTPSQLYAFDLASAPLSMTSDPNPTCVMPLITSDLSNTPVTVGESRLPDGFIFGVTSDDDGNIYVVQTNNIVASGGGTNPNANSQIFKYSSSGVLIAVSDRDNVQGMTYPGTNPATGNPYTNNDRGFASAIGIVYSTTTDQIYVSTTSPTDDCVALFNRDLDYVGSAVPFINASSAAKGIAIGEECCPTSPNQVVDLVVCTNDTRDPIFLNEIFPCDGTICEAQWTEDAANPAAILDMCDLSLDITAAAGCYTFTRSSDGSGLKQCGPFSQTLHVEIVELPDLTVSGDQTVACGEAASDLTATTTATILRWESNTTSCGADDDWMPIPGTAGMNTYNPGSPSQTTHYRAVISGTGAGNGADCPGGDCELASPCVTVATETICEVGFDLALTKVPSSSTGVYRPGQMVSFDITIFNQGIVDAFDIDVADYFDSNELTFSSFSNTPATGFSSGSPNAWDFTIDELAAGEQVMVTITFMINVNFLGNQIVNNAEIVDAASSAGGPTAFDEDSQFSNTNDGSSNELSSDDDVSDDSNGGADNPSDEDDYDPAHINICLAGCGTFPWSGN
ncbi:MAG: DUF11 domain-containing protein [Bacteroidota bacterium]